jgi:hypothetical protein
MDCNKIIRHLVIKTDTNTNDSCVIGCFYSVEMALGFINEHIEETFGDNYYQKLHENKNSIAIYKYCRLWGKSLIAKIQILEYIEI